MTLKLSCSMLKHLCYALEYVVSYEIEPNRVWYILSKIPKGKVMTYGQLAEMAGSEKYARVVGNILKQLPAGTNLPWHRVINCKGSISFPAGSPQQKKQQKKLEAEGISINSGKIDLKYYRWNGE